MTTGAVAVRAGTPYREMTAMFRKHRVSGFPVVDDDGKVIGVVSETDLLAVEAAEPNPGAQPAPRGWRPHRKVLTVGEATAGALMTHPAVTVGPDETVRNAARLLHSLKLQRLPVVDRDGHLAGIISRSDVLSVFHRTDEEIRREVTQDVIADGFFTDPARFTVTVHDGIVTLQRRARRQHCRPGPGSRGRGRRPRSLLLSGLRAVFVTAGAGCPGPRSRDIRP
jgi:CBS domain-containing protein